ncbi:MAG: hypothetical protein JSS83_27605 [Cyanobacteria bacterium SZAS LIN-3]|nr:hypothetical protein [Cyanobacteria bacterium SZAS LIN-3]
MSEADSNLLDLALNALQDPTSDQAEKALGRIVATFEERFGDNQKEVASSLQSIAKQIESSGKAEMAMEFKQRTTAIMLIHSMERRRGKGSTLTGLPALAPVKPALYESIIYIMYFTSRFDDDMDFYKTVLEAKVTWEKEEIFGRLAALKLTRDPQVLLVENKTDNALPSPLPVVQVTDTFAAGTQLLGRGHERLGEVATPIGLAQIFKGAQAIAIVKRA